MEKYTGSRDAAAVSRVSAQLPEPFALARAETILMAVNVRRITGIVADYKAMAIG